MASTSYQKTELVLSTFLLAVCIFAFFSIRGLPADAKMFPNLVLGITVLSVFALYFRTLSGVSKKVQGVSVKSWHFFTNVRRFSISIACFSIYLFWVETLGFFVSSTLFVCSLAIFAGYRKYLNLFLATMGFLAFVYLVFILLFERPLPKEFFLSDIPVKQHIVGDYHV